MMQTKMAYLSERQDVLAENIANVDTPGYKPKDLEKLDFDQMAMNEAHKLKLRATSPTHIQPVNQIAQNFRSEKMDHTYDMTPTKNEVSVEEQMMKVAETNLAYQTTTNMYKKMSEMFKMAIGKT